MHCISVALEGRYRLERPYVILSLRHSFAFFSWISFFISPIVNKVLVGWLHFPVMRRPTKVLRSKYIFLARRCYYIWCCYLCHWKSIGEGWPYSAESLAILSSIFLVKVQPLASAVHLMLETGSNECGQSIFWEFIWAKSWFFFWCSQEKMT